MGMVVLTIIQPYLIESGTTGDLSGVVGKYDNKEVIEEMNIIARGIYWHWRFKLPPIIA